MLNIPQEKPKEKNGSEGRIELPEAMDHRYKRKDALMDIIKEIDSLM